MRCAICVKYDTTLTSRLCLRCYITTRGRTLDPEPLYPGDVVEIIKEDRNMGQRGFVVPCPTMQQSADVWVRLKSDRNSDPYYVPYARDDVKLFSRIEAR
jgi:hypothetical protein